MSNIKQIIRNSISPFILDSANVESNAVADALITAMESGQKLAIDAANQAFISTASDLYLEQRVSDLGIVKPNSLGLSDFVFRKLAISITAQKQVVKSINNLLETFYGAEAVRSYAQAGNAAPYALTDGMELIFTIDKKQLVYTVDANDFPAGSLGTTSADNLASAITKSIQNQGSDGFADVYQDLDLGEKFVRIVAAAQGPTSYLLIQGGDLQNVLGFPQSRGTTNTNTVWTMSKFGATMRFTWSGNSDPNLSALRIGDTALVYGDSWAPNTPIQNELRGSYIITNVYPGPITQGYFEVNAPTAVISGTPALSQATAKDMTFWKLDALRPNFRKRFALAWEPNTTSLKIYLPAVTNVVTRDLIGAAHQHLGKTTDDLTGIFGQANNTTLDVDNKYRLEIISPLSFRYYQPYDAAIGKGGADVWGFGGEISIPYSASKTYETGTVVLYSGVYYQALQQNGANTPAGSRTPNTETAYWAETASGVPISYIRRDNNWVYVVCENGYPHGLESVPTNLDSDTATWSSSTNYSHGSLVRYGTSAPYGLYLAVNDPPTGDLPDQSISWKLLPETYNKSFDIVTIQSIPTIEDQKSFVGAYVYEPTANYELSAIEMTLGESIQGGNSYRTLKVDSTDAIPDATSYIAFDFGLENEELPIPVVGKLKGRLVLDPSYKFKYSHTSGSKITFLTDNKFNQLDPDGLDYGFYVTGTADARTYCQELITQITALGIKLEIVILYPKDIGWGGAGNSTSGAPHNDVVWIYDPDTATFYGET